MDAGDAFESWRDVALNHRLFQGFFDPDAAKRAKRQYDGANVPSITLAIYVTATILGLIREALPRGWMCRRWAERQLAEKQK